ncbi:hypothetical protein ABZX12_18635 [Kribbella sp. NPDC003505]
MTEFAPDYTPETPIEAGGVYDPEAPQPGAPSEDQLAADTVLFPTGAGA